jgi:hypothetical protein
MEEFESEEGTILTMDEREIVEVGRGRIVIRPLWEWLPWP